MDSRTILPASPRQDWLNAPKVLTYDIYLMPSTLTPFESLTQFLSLPYTAKTVPYLQWDLIPEYSTVRFYVKEGARYKLIGQAKRSSMVALLERLRRPRPGRFYAEGRQELLAERDG